jgi:hypothetical protein
MGNTGKSCLASTANQIARFIKTNACHIIKSYIQARMLQRGVKKKQFRARTGLLFSSVILIAAGARV